jgi:hypothetical protein
MLKNDEQSGEFIYGQWLQQLVILCVHILEKGASSLLLIHRILFWSN